MEYFGYQKEEIIQHLRTKKSSFLIWESPPCYSISQEITAKEIQEIIGKENLPYSNNGCFMGCHSWRYVGGGRYSHFEGLSAKTCVNRKQCVKKAGAKKIKASRAKLPR